MICQPYFCGQDPRCLVLDSPWARFEAESNLERHFPVVGILEHLGATFAVLERELPHFFKGISKLYMELKGVIFAAMLASC